jgi:hypothetical protein
VSRLAVISEVNHERRRQDEKWGEQNHPNGTGRPGDADNAAWAKRRTDRRAGIGLVTWRDILTEEFYEVLAESDLMPLRAELIQVAAVAVAWVEAIDRAAA